MGMGIVGSSCSSSECGCGQTYVYVNEPSNPNPNPNPRRFEIVDHFEYDNAYVLVVKYPDCTNYEGTKILVKRGHYSCFINELDPHFCKTDGTLVARFVPTDEGLHYAKQLAEVL